MEKSPQPSPPRSRRSRRRTAAANGAEGKIPEQSAEKLAFAMRMKGTLPEKVSSKDLEILNVGLRLFFADLRAARKVLGDNQRRGALVALGALMRFSWLFEAILAERLDLPFGALRGALLGLDENIVEPMLQPVTKIGRSGSSMARQALKGHVAAAIQRLFQAGISTADANRLVAKELKKLGLRPERGSSDVTATTVRHWGDEVAADVARTGVAAVVFDGMFADDEVKGFASLPSDQARKAFALASLAAFAREVILGTQNPLNPPI